jgi:hypothetical protein
MKCVLLATVVVCTLVPSVSFAQVPPINGLVATCGPIRMANQAYQFGHYGLWLKYIVGTHRDLNSCPIEMAVEAHVPGAANSALTATGWMSAVATKEVMVPHAGRWEASGKHDVLFWLVGPLFYYAIPINVGHSSTPVDIVAREEEYFPAPDPAWQCEIEGGRWLGGECQPANSPLIVDTARDGYRLTSVENGVQFDLNADGVMEQVAWTKRDSDDAFLAMDRNGNGRIDNGAELFGNHTPVIPTDPTATTPNGFEALKFIETHPFGPSERNEIIDAHDAAYARLVLWRDTNHNGLSEPDELQPVSESGLAAIYTEYKNSKRVDRHGNEFRQRSKVRWSDGQYDHIFDIWLNWRK